MTSLAKRDALAPDRKPVAIEKHVAAFRKLDLGGKSLLLNRTLLKIFAVLLLVIGVAGLVMPSRWSSMSVAWPYDVFHIAAALVALRIAFRGTAPAAAGFNAAFGIIDIWQAIAGWMGWFPAGVFALTPVDHIVHIVVGLGLLVLGLFGILLDGTNEGLQVPYEA